MNVIIRELWKKITITMIVKIINFLMASLPLCIFCKEFNMRLNVCYCKPKVYIQPISRFVFYCQNITECSLG